LSTNADTESTDNFNDVLVAKSSARTVKLIAIPKVESHSVMISNDLVDFAERNSSAMQNLKQKGRSTSDFCDEYKLNEWADHDKEMDYDDDDYVEGDHDSGTYDGESPSNILPPPPFTFEGKETYFQFDYRNHKTEVNPTMKNLLNKIEKTIHNAHLEPYGKFRGVATIRLNIALMEEGEKFRLGRRKSWIKDGTLVPIRKWPPNLTGQIRLKRDFVRILKDRHTIYTAGNMNVLSELKWKKIGQGFFGPDSDICVKPADAVTMLRDLWFRGESNLFNKFQHWHFRLLEKKKKKDLLSPQPPTLNEPTPSNEKTVPIPKAAKKHNRTVVERKT
jgi:hypothetical protein